MALFERRSNEEEPENRYRRSGYVPASMRERPAPAVMAVDEADDEHDEEIEFLANLAGEVSGTTTRDGGRKPAARADASEEYDDPLAAFRTVAAVSEQNEGVRRHLADDVEISDLLDELNVTMAALRRRRAA